MKVFVTGGSGYVGTAVITALQDHGHTVTALARSDRSADAVRGLGATAVRGELTDLEVLSEAAVQSEAVIHLAQATTGAEDRAAAEAMLDGVGSGTYVHTGGTWVYGDTDGVADEDAPWNPPAIVGWRRDVEDAVLGRVCDGRTPVVIRPGLVYGGQNRLIEEFVIQPARSAGAVAYIGDGSAHWALVHVEDLAHLYVAALDASAGSVYIGVGGVNPSTRDVAEAISSALGLTATPVSIPLDEARSTMGPVADALALDQQLTPARAQRELAWAPAHLDPLGELSQV
ncbi:NAD-dependent epimerase/dehydratase family protein [Gordonia otitidis]|uniref:NAD-dependent epimerase/dehydratase family protein n=1 Tax=Gordonia otitidis TaxID=249058 RepID=UPI001D1490D4|nr:NAD-dependent epimerase/dehydratase family protein [Gordonia otitidis]UEA57555.1 NAD-dependent epimerase/dehydratase family protein [Gordonia otitidis]